MALQFHLNLKKALKSWVATVGLPALVGFGHHLVESFTGLLMDQLWHAQVIPKQVFDSISLHWMYQSVVQRSNETPNIFGNTLLLSVAGLKLALDFQMLWKVGQGLDDSIGVTGVSHVGQPLWNGRT